MSDRVFVCDHECAESKVDCPSHHEQVHRVWVVQHCNDDPVAALTTKEAAEQFIIEWEAAVSRYGWLTITQVPINMGAIYCADQWGKQS